MTGSLRLLARRAAVAAAAGGLVLTFATTQAQALTGTTVAGPVVGADQHVNGAAISWSSVAATGARLGVVEATDGAHYRNPWFSADYPGARNAGLVRGSFAVARPALPIIATAQQQADYYLAKLGGTVTTTRTLTPVLDLETTGGLKSGQLVTWAQTFLLRIQAKTGRVPMLRTYAYFWHTALADQDAFARYPLWIEGTLAPGDPVLTDGVPALTSYVGTSWVNGVPARTTTTTVNADDDTWAWLRDGTVSSPWADGAPGAPQSVAARAYNGSATVSWLPGDTGSTPITAYHVLAEPGDIAMSVHPDVTQVTLPALANDTTYTFTVTADNADGTGISSDISDPVTPSGTLGAAPVPVTHTQRPLYTTNCAPPRSVVPGTRWTVHRPASGVVLKEGQRRFSDGIIRMHVLLVDAKNPHVRFASLSSHVADRRTLTSWANRRGFIAGTNAGYFDLGSGAPVSPIVKNGQAQFGNNVASTVVGFDPSGLLTSSAVATAGTVAGPYDQLPLAGWNPAQPVEGINVYTTSWGAHAVPMPKRAISRVVRNGSVTTATSRQTTVPSGSYLFVATGTVATGWLRALAIGDHVTVTRSTTSTTRTPLTLGYAVGGHLVNAGAAIPGLTCKISERRPARTAIGWTKDRRHLILVAIDNKPHSKNRVHGVEPEQLAWIMHDLGSDQAYMFDGGGSTEMVAHVGPRAKLTIRNYPSDGTQRHFPVGFGIFRR